MVRVVYVCLFAVSTVWAQADAIRAQMEASLEKQRQSIRTQAASVVNGGTTNAAGNAAPGGGFFTTPWPKPVSMPAPFADCDPLPKDKVDALIDKASKTEGVKPDIIRQVMQRESAFKPCAISTAGAQGLMQLMPATAGQFGVKDPFDPDQNVAAGTKFLKELLQKYNGDLTLALAAYNSGPATVDKANGVPNIPETQSYVSEILKKLVL